MSALDRAEQTALAHIEEIAANVRIRLCYNEFVVGQAQSLFQVLSEPRQKQALQTALKDKAVDPAPLFRGLIIQLNGVFENFVRSLVAAVLADMQAKAAVYSQLDDALRREHVVRSAAVLASIKEGSVKGQAYDFEALCRNLGACFTDANPYSLNSEVFTMLMGNCTSTRLEELFKSVGLPEPFSDELAEAAGLRSWANEKTSRRRTVNRAREELDRQIKLRNDLAHGNITQPVTQTDLETSVAFFGSLVVALKALVARSLL